MLLIRNPVYKNLVVIIAASALCSVLSIATYHFCFSQRTIVLDIAGFIMSQKEGYMTGQISAGELVDNIDTVISHIRTIKRNELFILDRTAMGSLKNRSPGADPAAEDEDGWEK